MDNLNAVSQERTQSPLRYRSDIDGLRCIAVLSVMFFHVGLISFGGGWVGVDVFFVVSGFLITRLIADEVERGTFSFGKFYIRRARRLFASLIFTIAASFIVGSVVFDPRYFQHFAGEIVYALGAASNIFYWLDGGYFGIAEEYKPLLHTWSLGVEEQFYLVWPLALCVVLSVSRKLVLPVLVAAFIASLVAAEYFFSAGRENAVFFLLPSRIFEFAIGAMLVWILRDKVVGERLRETALIVGLGLIGFSVFFFTKETPFPGFYALVPCGGAALAIYGGDARRVRPILGNRLMVVIGKISYSLYLIHWPIIVFYRYHRLVPLSHVEQLSICTGSIACAALMYRYVEQPFRNPERIKFPSKAAFGLLCVSAVIVLLIPAAIVWAKGSLFWRGSELAFSQPQLEQILEQREQDEVDAVLRDRSFVKGNPGQHLMFLGDSHSGDIAAALYLALGTQGFDYARLGFDDPCFSSVDRRPWILRIVGTMTECEVQIAALKKSQSLADADIVFIANYWNEKTIKGFDEGLALLRTLTKAAIVVVGQNATFPTFDDSLRFLGSAQLQTLNTVFFSEQSATDIKINEQLLSLAARNDLGFIDRRSLVCSAAQMQCRVIAADGRFLYSDRTHWTYAGRKVFGHMIVQKYGHAFLTSNGQ
jgi:peptidoglycan/LPS O-acetylase OafA/YrhL